LNDIVQQFIDQMIQDGCAPQYPSEIQPTSEDTYVTLQGDKKPGRLSYYLSIEGDGFAHGNYRNFRTSQSGKWHSFQNNKKLTAEEKSAFAEKIKRADADRAARKEKIYLAAAKKANSLWNKAIPCESHPYLTAKKIKPHGVKILGDNLFIPLSQDGKIVTYQTIDPTGDKLYQPGGRKSGSYFCIGEPGYVICIAEGLATAASVFEATGYATFAAMDAGNLMDVSLAVRKLYPDSLIVITSDSDQWSKNQKGELFNTGVIRAKEAAMKINGFECHPDFPNDDPEQRTDMNDLACSEGLPSVKAIIDAVIDSQPPAEDPEDIYMRDMGEPTITEDGEINLTEDMGLPFRILGYNGEKYYYFPFEKQQIVSFTPAQHTINNLIQLATLEEWRKWALRAVDAKVTPKELALFAFDEMATIATSRKVFAEEDRIRGCGVWNDAGRVVLHCGDKLLVDGVLTEPRNLASRYVYSAAKQLIKPHSKPLSKAESHELRKICTMLNWENPLSGLLLAGWLVAAPLGDALPWRPHIWITGPAGAGKSTVLNQIIRQILGEFSLNLDGGSSEPSIRALLGHDARPIVYDEAEGKTGKFSLMDGVLGLSKVCSSGGTVTKAGQKNFIGRSAFCFSAINPPIKDYASETRISLMTLKKNTSPNSSEQFKAIMAEITKTITPEYGRRLLSRSVKLMPVMLKNIKTFRDAACDIIKDARAADQISPMLAGLYLLGNDGEISESEARKWISEKDWTEHTAISEAPDHERLLHHISTSIVTVKTAAGNRDHTIGTLIAAAVNKNDEIGPEAAKVALRNYSILARTDGVFIGNKNQNLEKVLRGTDWEINWNKTLVRTPGSKNISNQYFGSGDTQRCIKIPAELFFGEEKPGDDIVEVPFD